MVKPQTGAMVVTAEIHGTVQVCKDVFFIPGKERICVNGYALYNAGDLILCMWHPNKGLIVLTLGNPRVVSCHQE